MTDAAHSVDAATFDAAVVPVDAPSDADAIVASVDASSNADAAVTPVDAQPTVDAAAPSIIMFSSAFSGGQFNGAVLPNFGGRVGADSLCQTIAASPGGALTCPTGVHAFLSVDAADQLKDMPTHYGVPIDEPIVAWFAGGTIASDWSHLFGFTPDAGQLQDSLGHTGVMWDGAYWFSGSDTNGAFTSDNETCNNWTSTSVVLSPSMGYSSFTSYQWLQENGGEPDYYNPGASGPNDECNQVHVLVCICY